MIMIMIHLPLFRFRLHFEKESKEDVEKRKKIAREKVLQPVSDKELEMGINDIYPSEKGSSCFFFNSFHMTVSK